jgi:hypothetical protein
MGVRGTVKDGDVEVEATSAVMGECGKCRDRGSCGIVHCRGQRARKKGGFCITTGPSRAECKSARGGTWGDWCSNEKHPKYVRLGVCWHRLLCILVRDSRTERGCGSGEVLVGQGVGVRLGGIMRATPRFIEYIWCVVGVGFYYVAGVGVVGGVGWRRGVQGSVCAGGWWGGGGWRVLLTVRCTHQCAPVCRKRHVCMNVYKFYLYIYVEYQWTNIFRAHLPEGGA